MAFPLTVMSVTAREVLAPSGFTNRSERCELNQASPIATTGGISLSQLLERERDGDSTSFSKESCSLTDIRTTGLHCLLLREVDLVALRCLLFLEADLAALWFKPKAVEYSWPQHTQDVSCHR